MKVQYFLRGRHCGEVNRPPYPSPACVPKSVAFLCTHCGEVWARVLLPVEGWTWKIRQCDASLLLDSYAAGYTNYDPHFDTELFDIAVMPDAFIRREFDLLMQDI